MSSTELLNITNFLQRLKNSPGMQNLSDFPFNGELSPNHISGDLLKNLLPVSNANRSIDGSQNNTLSEQTGLSIDGKEMCSSSSGGPTSPEDHSSPKLTKSSTSSQSRQSPVSNYFNRNENHDDQVFQAFTRKPPLTLPPTFSKQSEGMPTMIMSNFDKVKKQQGIEQILQKLGLMRPEKSQETFSKPAVDEIVLRDLMSKIIQDTNINGVALRNSTQNDRSNTIQKLDIPQLSKIGLNVNNNIQTPFIKRPNSYPENLEKTPVHHDDNKLAKSPKNVLMENAENWRQFQQAAYANNLDPHVLALYQNVSFSQQAGNAPRRKNATRETTSMLKAWLNEHRKNPYPTKGEKIMLAIITKMSLTQVSTWFANARRRLKKENKVTWTLRSTSHPDDDLEEDSDDDNDEVSTKKDLDDEDDFDLGDEEKRSDVSDIKSRKRSHEADDSNEPSRIRNKIWSVADIADQEHAAATSTPISKTPIPRIDKESPTTRLQKINQWLMSNEMVKQTYGGDSKHDFSMIQQFMASALANHQHQIPIPADQSSQAHQN